MTNNLQSLIDKAGISQYSLAKSLKIPSQQVNEWCRNKKLVGVEWAFKIKGELGLKSIEDIYDK